MQLIGIYINKADKDIRKTLNENWYGFSKIIKNNISKEEYKEKYDNFITDLNNQNNIYKRINIIQNNFNYEEYQSFNEYFYEFNDGPLSISSIVGKNGSGKSTLLNIYNRIINNFASKIKEVFNEYNCEYVIKPEPGLDVELYYELSKKIYCIKISGKNVKFINEKGEDLFKKIKDESKDENGIEDTKKQLEILSNHIFYTITCNYSLYTDYPEWMRNLYHKNDGYFTPIVLVPYRSFGNIEINREQQLAEKRVQTLSLLMYKFNEEGKKDFIENYLPYEISFRLKDAEFFKEKKIYKESNDDVLIDNYNSYIDEKNYTLKQEHTFKDTYKSTYESGVIIKSKKIPEIEAAVNKYWNDYFKNEKNQLFIDYCKPYLKYKTLKSIINYESIAKKINFENNNLESNIKNIIEKHLLNEDELNYINLKIIMCKRFMRFSYDNIYSTAADNKIKIDVFLDLLKDKKINNYHEMFSYLLPDFYDIHFFYKKEKTSNDDTKIELSQMSSGEQHLYNSLSYIVYHIQNAKSNQNGDTEGKITYKNFNVFFDEAELYYHPDYQRTLIKNITKLLSRTSLKLEGINITLVTHSPFILSDIQSDSILALENGNVSDKLNETLGANVYDLLANQFFMNSTIGEASKTMIETIIKNCKNPNYNIDNDYNFYRNFINKLGDYYLKTVLLDMINEKKGISFINRKIEEYKMKIDNLSKSE